MQSGLVKEAYTGRVYIFFSKKQATEPRKVFRFLHAEPILTKDVQNWNGDDPVVFSSDKLKELLTFPQDMQSIDLSQYRAQAIVRLNKYDPQMGAGSPNGEGNGYSPAVWVTDAKQTDGVIELVVDKIIPTVEVVESETRKHLAVPSPLLTRFYGREIVLHAAVNLPASYATSPDKHYPVLFDIPSFGGSHHFPRSIKTTNDRDVEFIEVDLDATCPLGHHVYADSDNNGPYGTALVQELIPALDAQFRTVPRPQARFLTGVSSGGWSSLWVQVTHPDDFNGTWSCSPDPVDFRDFQRINLYDANQNMYHDQQGNRRPITSTNTMWFDELTHLETVLGDGGQLHSFEAVFSAKGPDGKPCRLWNRESGAIDQVVVRQWERFDINKHLRRNWSELESKLRGKLSIHVDSSDSFLLEGAVIKLKQSLAELGSDATVTIHPTTGHGGYISDKFFRTIANQMADRYLASGQ
jgi:S-formylglutathione hydrolase FrmB